MRSPAASNLVSDDDDEWCGKPHIGILFRLVSIPTRQCDVQNLCGPDRIFEEHFIKIPHSKKEQCVRMKLFLRHILPHHWGNIFQIS